jgi:hypothetical protein
MRWSFVLALAACGSGSSDATISGHVYLDGMTDNSGIIVYEFGRQLAEDAVVTDASGAYVVHIADRDARYFLVAGATSTLERDVQIYLDLKAGQSATAPDMHLTPVGVVTGTVTLAGATMGNGGIVVSVEGTSVTGTTDDSGAYTLRDVPIGTHAVVATKDGYAEVATPGQTVAYAQTTTVPAVSLPAK